MLIALPTFPTLLLFWFTDNCIFASLPVYSFHIFLSLNMPEYVSFSCFIHLQSFHPSVLPWAQQSDHGLPPKRVSSLLMCKEQSKFPFVCQHIFMFVPPHKIHTTQYRFHTPVTSTEVTTHLHTPTVALKLYI